MALFNLDAPSSTPLTPPPGQSPQSPQVTRVQVVSLHLSFDQVFAIVWKVVVALVLTLLLPVAALIALGVVLASLTR